MSEPIYRYIKARDLESFALGALKAKGVRDDVAFHVAEGLTQTSLRGVDSHGIRLLPHYLNVAVSGRINRNPDYKFEKTAAASGRLDADHTFGHAAGSEGIKRAIQLAEDAGTGTVAIYNSSHFGAAAYFALQAAQKGYIAFSFTHADSLMNSYGGTRSFFGTNPICMAVPCKGEEPFCLDMATSRVTWNKILHHREMGQSIPESWAVDKDGNGNPDPNQVVSLQPIGDYKGYGLGMMVEILCGLLTGMPFGHQISSMYKAPIEEKRYLGHFVMVWRLDCFGDAGFLAERMKQMMDEVRAEPAADKNQPVMVPGDPEKIAAKERTETGIPIPLQLWETFEGFSRDLNVPLRGIDG